MAVAAADIAVSLGISEHELMREALIAFIQEKRRQILQARLEIVSRYQVETVGELEQQIEDGGVPEHPAWEDLIVVENLDARLGELDAHLSDL